LKSYQDLQKANAEGNTMEFVYSAIVDHKTSELYREAHDAYEYYKKRNPTIVNFQKLLYEVTGRVVPDNYSSNYKFRNAFFPKFIKQENAYLLGNGVTFNEDKTKDALGGDDFDSVLLKAGIASLWGAVSYGFYDNGKVTVFDALEFAPLLDEETGALRAGVRFWQLDITKPLRATLYEEDGFTDYMWKDGHAEILREKRPYILRVATSPVDGVEILDGRNYPTFPIVPLWGNEEHQSELVGLREKIDGYDLIQSGFANNVDDASIIYWTLQNAGGMDDIDMTNFVKRLREMHIAAVDESGVTAEPHTPNLPTEARKAILSELKETLYSDAMAIDPTKIGGSGITNVAIKASYADLDLKCDGFEACVTDFIRGLLAIVEIEDSPTYKRNMIVNSQEETTQVLAAAQYLDDETVLRHLPFITPDEIDRIVEAKVEEEEDRYAQMQEVNNNADGRGEDMDGQTPGGDGEGTDGDLSNSGV
jgi:hypothetical protein